VVGGLHQPHARKAIATLEVLWPAPDPSSEVEAPAAMPAPDPVLPAPDPVLPAFEVHLDGRFTRYGTP